MNNRKHNVLLSKIHELKALFIFGQRVIPFLEDLFQFVQEVIPILEEMNTSIRESTSQIPHASSKLSDVTRATELATTEILDIIDFLLMELGGVRAEYRQMKEELGKMIQLDDSMARLIKKEISDSHPELMDKLKWMYREKRSLGTRLNKRVDGLERSLEKIHQNANNIMISLQVQDITAQQIAAVTHMIHSMENRLTTLLGNLNEYPLNAGEGAPNLYPQSFNPEASYTDSRHQHRVDAIVNALQKSEEKDTTATVEPVDPGGSISGHKNHPSQAEPSENNKTQESDSTTQEEIDKLFERNDG